MTTIQRVNTPSTFYAGTTFTTTQTNPFNMLYFQRDMNVKKEMEAQSARHNKSFHIRKTYDDTYNQLSQLYTNGRPFQQIYKPDVVSIPYRDYEDVVGETEIYLNILMTEWLMFQVSYLEPKT